MVSFYMLIVLTFICPVSGGLIIGLYDKNKGKRVNKIFVLIDHMVATLGTFVGAWFSAKKRGYFYPINYLFLTVIISLVVIEIAYCIFSKKIYK